MRSGRWGDEQEGLIMCGTDQNLSYHFLTAPYLQHTYLSYGPLLCGATNVIYEGVPSYPSPARCWEIVERYKVHCFPPWGMIHLGLPWISP